VVKNASKLIDDFKKDCSRPFLNIRHEAQPAPHAPHGLPLGKCAVYVFSLSASYGGSCPAGPDRVLKIGKAGPNSNARFQSQHYNPGSSMSNLAKALLNERGRWQLLGITALSTVTVGNWVRHLDRDNFYLDSTDKEHLGELEKYLKSILGSVFEGG
jgi:hypothetical protein